MLHLRIVCGRHETGGVVDVLTGHPGIAHLTVDEGVAREPAGDVVQALVARESAADVLDEMERRGVPHSGQVSLHPLEALLSETADAAARAAPGEAADAVIWDELVDTTGEESRLNAVFLAFLTLACLLAAVGVITDSPITIVGAMVVSPDFGPLAALAVAVVGGRRDLAVRAGLALGVGFPFAVLATAAIAGIARLAGVLTPADVADLSGLSFIYEVGPYSVVTAILAGAAGMLALTSAKPGALIGVFISATTVPAAGLAALAAVMGDWARCGGAALQLAVNLVGLTVAGVLTLALRRRHAVAAGRALRAGRRHAPGRCGL